MPSVTEIQLSLITDELKPSVSRRYRGIVRKIVPVACVLAFLMSFDSVHVFVVHADPHLKALLGAGLFFFCWLLVLWDDLLGPAHKRPTAGVSDNRPIAQSSRPFEKLLRTCVGETLNEPFAVLVASHLQMQADDPADAAPIPDRRRRRARIMTTAISADEPGPSLPMPAVDETSIGMPPALRSYVGRHRGALEWHTILPGIKQCRIARNARGGDASLLRCRPGSAIPAHTHEGLEAVLVLQGGFRDQSGHYDRGDIAVADDTIDHRPVADPAAECIIFIVLEAPVKLTGRFGRLIQRLVGSWRRVPTLLPFGER